MQFWEGAILVVGGVFLVSYMAKRNLQPVVVSTGFSNASNLTTIGNPSTGNVVAGEPLTPPLAPPLQPVSVKTGAVAPIRPVPVQRFMAL